MIHEIAHAIRSEVVKRFIEHLPGAQSKRYQALKERSMVSQKI
jgi:hypothetical protein